MPEYGLGRIEGRFAAMIWESEPVSSGELVRMAERELGWKKSTTYTILRRFCEKGLFKNENGVVTSLVKREEFDAERSERFVEDTFDGSLPQFLAAFTSRKRLTEEEIGELERLIEAHREGGR